jgi:hypothetical protein
LNTRYPAVFAVRRKLAADLAGEIGVGRDPDLRVCGPGLGVEKDAVPEFGDRGVAEEFGDPVEINGAGLVQRDGETSQPAPGGRMRAPAPACCGRRALSRRSELAGLSMAG